MPRPKQSTIAIQPAQGKKKTFDDDVESEEDDYPVAGPSRSFGSVLDEDDDDEDDWSDEDDDDDDDDDDDAPEAVSVGVAQKGLEREEEAVVKAQMSKREAAAARSKAIADAKAASRTADKSKKVNKPNPAGTKRKLNDTKAAKDPKEDVEEEEDADAKRLRKRMEAAMAAGDDESGSDDEEGEEDSDEEEGGEEYHTDSEDEAGSGEEEEDVESDSSETLKDDGPISDKERQMRKEMQAMMEAAEARSGVKTSKPEAKGKEVKSAMKGGKRKIQEVEAVEEEEDNFDLAPLSGFGKPLSAKVLQAAIDEEEAKKGRQAEAERREKQSARELKKDKRKKRKLEKVETVKLLSNGKHLQILEPELPKSGSGLPPIMPARSTKPAGAESRTRFFKTAMKTSGMIPGKGIVDGRKKAIASRMG